MSSQLYGSKNIRFCSSGSVTDLFGDCNPRHYDRGTNRESFRQRERATTFAQARVYGEISEPIAGGKFLGGQTVETEHIVFEKLVARE